MPTIRVETPKGVIEFPEGTSEQDINEAVAQLMDDQGAWASVKNAVVGAGKAVANEVLGMAEAGSKLLFPADIQLPDGSVVKAPRPDFSQYRQQLQPTKDEQTANTVMNALLFAAPTGGKVTGATRLARLGERMVGGAVNAATHSTLQGNTPEDTSHAALIGAAMPVATGPIGAAASWLGGKAERMVQSAVKPTVTSLKQTSGASREGINVVAKRMARFIIDNKITTPDKAEAIIKNAETELQSLLTANGGTLTDAGARAERYLFALRRSARKQGIPADDVEILDAKIRGFMRTSPLTESVQATNASGAPVFDANGLPVMIRVPRQDVTAQEALDVARNTGRWSTRKQWGEQKGAAVEADKAVERAARDATKRAVPGASPLLARESKAIGAKQALDRMFQREGNTNPIDLPSYVVAGGGHGFWAAVNLFLNKNKLRAGIIGDAIGRAERNNDVRSAIAIMRQLGAGAAIQPFLDEQPVASHDATTTSQSVMHNGQLYRMVGTDEQGNAILEPWE